MVLNSTATRSRRFFSRQNGPTRQTTQPLCGWRIIFIHDPRVAEAATLGWRTQPLCGFVPGTEVNRFRKLDSSTSSFVYKQPSPWLYHSARHILKPLFSVGAANFV